MKTVPLLLLCLLISVITMDFSCQKQTDNYHSYYTVQNQAAHAIYSDWNFDSSVVGSNYPPALSPPSYRLEANSSRTYGYRGNAFEYGFNNPPTNNRLFIYIYDAQVLETTNWDTVRKYNMYLRKYTYTKPQMDSLGWRITYH